MTIFSIDELNDLLEVALRSGQVGPLEDYLTGRSGLPGPRMNLALAGAFADRIGQLVGQPDPPVAALETLLDGWAGLPLEAAPVNDPREMLPAVAVLAYGQVGVVRPDWWEDELGKLGRAASSPRWRTREMVAAALQRLLAHDWPRTITELDGWLLSDDPLVIRAVVASLAEPPLLKKKARRAEESLAIQIRVVERFTALSPECRHCESVRVLRQALGYTLSVSIASSPAKGYPFVARLAASSDPDIQWIVRENLKKKRLAGWEAWIGKGPEPAQGDGWAVEGQVKKGSLNE